MIKFEVNNRFSSQVQFTAEIDCSENESYSVKLGLAVKWAIKTRANLARADLADAYLADAYLANANLVGANLAGAYLVGANLADAYLADADLAGADLADADLAGADLAGADLVGANLAGAYLGEDNWVIQGPTRSDGHTFLLTNLNKEGVRIKAGCRNFSLAEARAHWENTRKDTPLGNETFAILDCLEALAKARGYIV